MRTEYYSEDELIFTLTKRDRKQLLKYIEDAEIDLDADNEVEVKIIRKGKIYKIEDCTYPDYIEIFDADEIKEICEIE